MKRPFGKHIDRNIGGGQLNSLLIRVIGVTQPFLKRF
jgi:hypothetical protein